MANNRRTNTTQNEYRRSAYVYGNAVRKEVPVYRDNTLRRELERPIERTDRNRNTLQRQKSGLNLGFMAFIVAALAASAYILIGYIQLRSEVTNTTKTISAMESQLNDLRVANDEAYTRINSGIDLDEIKDIAINRFGMIYAQEGQIIVYSDAGNDYMRSVDND
ncbi:MAG: cell division protein FtsL [Lachnospiraceae bacterium]|nr:cell division protein FtsL [Lachnospiraceae bacterium]